MELRNHVGKAYARLHDAGPAHHFLKSRGCHYAAFRVREAVSHYGDRSHHGSIVYSDRGTPSVSQGTSGDVAADNAEWG